MRLGCLRQLRLTVSTHRSQRGGHDVLVQHRCPLIRDVARRAPAAGFALGHWMVCLEVMWSLWSGVQVRSEYLISLFGGARLGKGEGKLKKTWVQSYLTDN